MKQTFIAIFPVIFLICACHSSQPKETAGNNRPLDSAKKNYLPVEDYLKYEIALVDSFPRRLMRYRISQGKTDSGIITTPIFDQIASEFLLPELDSGRFEKKFEENSFVDRSTNLISFTYSTIDTGFGLKRVDVLLLPGAGMNKLNSIYMEAISGNPDTTVISKYSWKAGRNFSILHIKRPKNGLETSNQTLVMWDSRD